MNLELHLLQNFALSNLNRDESGAPKDCEFGGVRRTRISSQCLKRAIRLAFAADGLGAAPDAGSSLELAVRTRRITRLVGERLGARGVEGDEASALASAAIQALGLRLASDETEYLLYVAPSEVDRLAEVALAHRDTLLAGGDAARVKRTGRARDVGAALGAVLDGGRAIDLALFGRMVADLPSQRLDSACQVAHALSVHRATAEFDFFSALDDLADRGGVAASRIDSVILTSACFYRYQNLSLDLVAERLRLDPEGVAAVARRFVRACVRAIPTGRQSGTGAQNLPSLILVVLRERGYWSLANAFEVPVRAGEGKRGIVAPAIDALAGYWTAMRRAYGDDDFRGQWAVALTPEALGALEPWRTASVDEAMEGVRRLLVGAEGARG